MQEVRVQAPPKTECQMIDASDPERAAAAVIAALDARGALEPRQHRRRAVSPAIRPGVRGRDLWVACETDLAGHVTRARSSCCREADALAPRLGGAVVALGYPASFASHAAIAASYGADHVLVLDHPELDAYSPEAAAEAIAQLVRARTPWGLLLPASERGRDWGPRLAARLGLGLTGDAIGIEIDSDDRMVALKPAFGGNIVAPILSKTYPADGDGALRRARARGTAGGEARRSRRCSPKLAPALSRLVATHSLLDESHRTARRRARSWSASASASAVPKASRRDQRFRADARAGMCATRRVTDAGWMPRQLQVGLTGKAIDPRLYFAIGVRGAPNHTVGNQSAPDAWSRSTTIPRRRFSSARISELSPIGPRFYPRWPRRCAIV